jgi:hypothetical protein
MTKRLARVREQTMLPDQPATTAWSVTEQRLADREPGRHEWLATVGPDGRPHLMPILAFWIDGGLHFLAGEGTRKGRDLAADARCVIATTSTALPSLDIVIEGRAEPLTDAATVERIARYLIDNGWPLQVRGHKVDGPNAPTAGPPPYTIYRLAASTAFGLPGTFGMDQFDPADLPKPTRYAFESGDSA